MDERADVLDTVSDLIEVDVFESRDVAEIVLDVVDEPDNFAAID